MPKVSIVIPTRNRAHLLKTALASAVGQTYDDMEIVVSDNYSTDDTKAVVDSFRSPKIRYVRTHKALDMPHSWEFAFHHAQGEFLTYLTDDSYLLPNAIDRAIAERNRFNSQMVVWGVCYYTAPDWLEPESRNRLIIPRFTFKSSWCLSESALQKFYDLRADASCPRVLNTLFHRKISEDALRIQKRLFLPSCPDYSAAIGLLCQVKGYVFIDEPLIMDVRTPNSIGAVSDFNWGRASQEFLSELEDTDFIKSIPLNIPTASVGIAQSLVNVKNYYPEMSGYEINLKNLVGLCANELAIHKSNGVDISKSWRTLMAYIDSLPRPQKIRLEAYQKKILMGLWQKLRRKLLRFPFRESLARLAMGFSAFHGEKWGFSNELECAAAVPRLIEKVKSRVL